MAALPALGLLAVVKIVLARTTTATPARVTTASRSASRSDRTDDRMATGHGETALSRSPTLAAAPSNRTATRPPQSGHPDPTAQPARPASDPDRSRHSVTGPVRSPTGPTPDQSQVRTEDYGPGPTQGRTRTTAAHGLDDLLDLGQAIAADLHRQQRPLTRATLTAGIRATGHTISTDTATALLRQLKTTNGHNHC